MKNILVAVAALAVGAAAGWFAAARACGDAAVSSKPPYQGDDSPACNNGRARSMSAPNEKAKPRRKALIRSSADAEVQKRILENKISYLEKCIAVAKGLSSKSDGSGNPADGRAGAPRTPKGRAGSPLPAENKRETNAEIIERLMKLPSDNERYIAFMHLDEKTQMSFTMGELKKLCPKQMSIDGDNGELYAELTERLDRMTEVASRRVGILDAFDPSGLNDEERRVHAEYMEFLAEWPDVFAGMIDQRDSMTFGEVIGRFKKAASTCERGVELGNKEREMLISQTIKSFEVPDEDAVELRVTFDEVRDATSFAYFEKKD